MHMGLAAAVEPTVIQQIDRFDDAGNRDLRPLTFWRWTPEQKQNAAQISQLQLVPEGEGKALKVSITQPLPRGMDYYPWWSTNLEYLPPETEAIRMRIKVLSGRFQISAGGPTSYFATSDVRTKPLVLEPGDWRTVELSLTSHLERNYRRPIFSQDSPVIYYTRWIQEPMRLLMNADSQGEMLVDDIELITRGNGWPFATFEPAAIRTLATADPATRFTFATDDREFDLSQAAGMKAVRKPAVLSAATDGRGQWTARQRGQEEMSFFGLKAHSPKGANAVRLTLKVEHKGPFELLAVDVFTLVGGHGEFPWEKTKSQAPSNATTDDQKAFDYSLSPARTRDFSWGFYHARRAVKNGGWTEVVIPFADFVCAYGNGSLKARHQQQQPLVAEEVTAVALLSPWRQRGADTVFTIEKIEFVAITGDVASWKSYVQVPDLSKIRLEKQPGPYGGTSSQVDGP